MLKSYRLNNHTVTETEKISEQVVTIDIDGKVQLFLSGNLGVYGTFYGQENLPLIQETFPNAIIREDYPETSEVAARYHVSSRAS